MDPKTIGDPKGHTTTFVAEPLSVSQNRVVVTPQDTQNVFLLNRNLFLVYHLVNIPKIMPLVFEKTLMRIEKVLMSFGPIPGPMAIILNRRTMTPKEQRELAVTTPAEELDEDADEVDELAAKITILIPIPVVLDKKKVEILSTRIRQLLEKKFDLETPTRENFNPLGPISVVNPTHEIVTFKPTELAKLLQRDGLPDVLRHGKVRMGIDPYTGSEIFLGNADISTSPLYTIGGSTGSGKSVLLRVMVELAQKLIVIDPGGAEKSKNGWDADPNFRVVTLQGGEIIDPLSLPYKGQQAQRGMFEAFMELLGFKMNIENLECLGILEYILFEAQPKTVYEFRDALSGYPEKSAEMLKILSILENITNPPMGDPLYVFKPICLSDEKIYFDISGSSVKGLNVALMLKYVVENMTPDRSATGETISLVMEEFARFAENLTSGVFSSKAIKRIINESFDVITKDFRKRGGKMFLTFHTFDDIEQNPDVAAWVKRVYSMSTTIDFESKAPNVTEKQALLLEQSDKDNRYAALTTAGGIHKVVKILLPRNHGLMTYEEVIGIPPESAQILPGVSNPIKLRTMGYDQYRPPAKSGLNPLLAWKADPFEDTEIALARHILSLMKDTLHVGNDIFLLRGERTKAVTLSDEWVENPYVRNHSEFYYFKNPSEEEEQNLSDILKLIELLRDTGLDLEPLRIPGLDEYVDFVLASDMTETEDNEHEKQIIV